MKLNITINFSTNKHLLINKLKQMNMKYLFVCLIAITFSTACQSKVKSDNIKTEDGITLISDTTNIEQQNQVGYDKADIDSKTNTGNKPPKSIPIVDFSLGVPTLVGNDNSEHQLFLSENIKEGVSLAKSGETTKALKLFKKEEKANPKNHYAWYYAALTHYSGGNTEEAIEILNDAIAKFPDTWHLFLLKGKIYYDLKEYKTALENYDKLLEISPNHREGLENRANIHLYLKNYEKAAADYERYDINYPPNSKMYYNMAYAQAQLGRYEDAEMNFTYSIQHNRNYLSAYLNRGNTYMMLKEYEKAIEDYDFVISNDAKHVNAYFNRGQAKLIINLDPCPDWQKAFELGSEDAKMMLDKYCDKK